MSLIARICVDSTFFSIDGTGNLTFRRESVGLQQMIVDATAGVVPFVKANYPGLTRIRVRAIGGGGGGAGADAGAGEAVARAGGSGGGYSESVLDAAALGASENVSVGLGGAGGVGNDNGEDGGDSSFGGFVLARGGRGAPTTMASGTGEFLVAGSASGPIGIGQIAVTGGPGGPAWRMAGGQVMGGAGGDAGGGFGGGGNARASDQTGANGTGTGGGGGGATSRGASFNGGAGAKGAVIIDLMY